MLLLAATGARCSRTRPLGRHLGSTPRTPSARLLPLELQRAVGACRRRPERRPTSRSRRARRPAGCAVTALPVGEDGSVLLVVRDVTEARRLDAVRRDFVANASHELKTPVASIQAAAETIRDAARRRPGRRPQVRRAARAGGASGSRGSSPTSSTSHVWSRAASSTSACAGRRRPRREWSGSKTRPPEAGLTLDVDADGARRCAGRPGTSRCWCATSSTTRSGTRGPGGTIESGSCGGDATCRAHRRATTGLGIPHEGSPSGLRALLPCGSRAVPGDRRHGSRASPS